MNLYAVSPDPKKCAEYLDTKRLGWVGIKESAQLIATALHCLYGVETMIKPSHENHPVAKWVRADKENLSWTWWYLVFCNEEYFSRLGKPYHINKVESGEIARMNASITRLNMFRVEYLEKPSCAKVVVLSFYKKQMGIWKFSLKVVRIWSVNLDS